MASDHAQPMPEAAADPVAADSVLAATRRWPMLLGGALVLAMVFGLIRALAGSGLGALQQAVPENPLFYIASALLYLSLPVGDFIIFRRLWGIPISGLAALIKKRIANEVVFGYSGEAYFYAWARQNARSISAPFGAVKDVSILSAIAGNAVTIAMVAIALPFGYGLMKPLEFKTLAGSVAIIFAMSVPFLIFGRQLFSLQRAQLWWIFMVHCLRLVAGSTLIALAWHFALPQISLGIWLLLAAARLLVSRLPLVPNKDLLFANFAILFIGQDQALSTMIALTSALTLLIHVVLVGAFSLFSLVRNIE